MESWDFDNVKAEKATAMRKYNGFRLYLRIAKLFRFAEILIALVFASWTFARLPFAINISRDYVRLLCGVVSSPLFVFLLCHVIIASLVLKSRHVSSGSAPNEIDAVDSKLHDEFIENSAGGDRAKSQLENDVVSCAKEEIVYQDKQIVSEVNSAYPKSDTESDSDTDSEFPKAIRRTKSQKFEREQKLAKLRRSETEISRKIVDAGEESLPADDLSNEEFQRIIEAFIEKQLKFRHQESMAIVLQN